MQAIITKYLGPTNCRGERIKATCDRGSITISFPHEIHDSIAHHFAARKLCEKFAAEDLIQYGTPILENHLMRSLISGGLPRNAGECHVFAQGGM